MAETNILGTSNTDGTKTFEFVNSPSATTVPTDTSSSPYKTDVTTPLGQSTIQNPTSPDVLAAGANVPIETTTPTDGADPITPTPTPEAPETPQNQPVDNTKAIEDTQAQIADLQAQAEALKKYGLTDTNQLTKDTTGNWIPKPLETPKPEVSTPFGIDTNTTEGLIEFYNKDPNAFSDWAKSQAIPWTDVQIKDIATQSASAKLKADAEAYSKKLEQLANGTYPLTAEQQAALEALRKQWDLTIEAQRKANETYSNQAETLAALSGRTKYNAVNVMGEVTQAIDTGINRVAQFQAASVAAVEKMRQAFIESNFNQVITAYNAIIANDKAISEEMNRIYDKAYAAQKDARDFEYMVKQDEIKNTLESNKFTYQQKKDAIDQALTQEGLDENYRHNLELEKARLLEIEQGYLQVTTNSYGEPVVIDKRTGEIKSNIFNPTQSDGLDSNNNSAYLRAVNQAVVGSSITESKTVRGQVNNYLKQGDYNAAKELILRTAIKNLGVDQQTQAIGRLQATAALDDIKTLINAYVAESGDTNIIKGTIENISEKLGTTQNPELAKIKNQIAQSLQNYRRAMTGVAFSPAEAAQYAEVFPAITDVTQLAFVKIDALMNTFNTNQKVAVGFAIGNSNYDELFGKIGNATNLTTYYVSNPDKQSYIDSIITDNPNLNEEEILQIINGQ